jgi:hypothetical protein
LTPRRARRMSGADTVVRIDGLVKLLDLYDEATV